MKLISATVYPLRLPFVASFAHSAKERDESGMEGFGEGAPREYVTGETQAAALAHIVETLWPSVARRPLALCSELPEFVPDAFLTQTVSDGASRCALELAILDLAL